MIRKSIFMSLLTMILVAMLTIGFTSCSKDDDSKKSDKDNTEGSQGGQGNQGTSVSDPVGTVSLSMLNESNGNTKFGYIYIDAANNFAGADFTSIGTVKGLGNVTKIPFVGWAGQLSVKPGCGYVAFMAQTFVRIYVEDYIKNGFGQIIGATIKYQAPFYGADEDIQLSDDRLELDYRGGSHKITLKNSSIMMISCESDQSWCVATMSLSDTEEGFTIYCEQNPTDTPREATITLTTHYGKKKTIKVKQAGWNKVGTGTKDAPFNVITALKYAMSLENESPTIYVQGKIVKINSQYNTQNGTAVFYIADDKDGEALLAYGILYLGNKKYASGDQQIKVGDDVIIAGHVHSYGNDVQTSDGKAYLRSLNGHSMTARFWIYGENPVSEPPFKPGTWDPIAMRFSSTDGAYLPTISDEVYYGLKTLIFDVSDVTDNFDLKVMNGWWSNTYYDHVKWVNGLNELKITETMAKECAKGGEGRDLDLMLYSGSMTLNAVYYEE